jgi:hypothetical protein
VVRDRARPTLSRPEQVVMGLPSLVLGIAPLFAPRAAARAMGVSERPSTLRLVRLIGLRELVVALIFLRHGSPRWLWGLVAQDAMDLPLCWSFLLRGEPANPDQFRHACLGYSGLAIVDIYTAVTRNVALWAHDEP